MLLDLRSLDGLLGGDGGSVSGRVARAPNCFIAVRTWERTDFPQRVYTGSLTLWEIPYYTSIAAETRASGRTDDQKSDRTYLQQTAPSFGWVQPIVEQVVSTWIGIFAAEQASARTPAPSSVVQPTVPLDGWVFSVLTPTVTTAQLWPAMQGSLSARPDARAGLDVRWDWPSVAWIPAVVDSVVSTWIPVFDAELGYRSGDRLALDVRTQDWNPEPAWIFTALPTSTTVAQQWPAILAALGLSYRSPDRALLDLPRSLWSPEDGWRFSVVDATVSTWSGLFASELASARAADRLIDRTYRQQTVPDDGWLFVNLPVPATTAQLWPAILQGLGLNYRSGDRAALDVRSQLWAPDVGSWIFVNLPAAGGAGPKLILVNGRLAIRIQRGIYEFIT